MRDNQCGPQLKPKVTHTQTAPVRSLNFIVVQRMYFNNFSKCKYHL